MVNFVNTKKKKKKVENLRLLKNDAHNVQPKNCKFNHSCYNTAWGGCEVSPCYNTAKRLCNLIVLVHYS